MAAFKIILLTLTAAIVLLPNNTNSVAVRKNVNLMRKQHPFAHKRLIKLLKEAPKEPAKPVEAYFNAVNFNNSLAIGNNDTLKYNSTKNATLNSQKTTDKRSAILPVVQILDNLEKREAAGAIDKVFIYRKQHTNLVALGKSPNSTLVLATNVTANAEHPVAGKNMTNFFEATSDELNEPEERDVVYYYDPCVYPYTYPCVYPYPYVDYIDDGALMLKINHSMYFGAIILLFGLYFTF